MLQGSYAAALIEQRLQDIIVNVAPGFVSGTDTYSTLGQVGISTVGEGQDDSLGTLSVDDTKLTDALNGNFEAVIHLFASSAGGSSSSQDPELLPGQLDADHAGRLRRAGGLRRFRAT